MPGVEGPVSGKETSPCSDILSDFLEGEDEAQTTVMGGATP